MADPPQRDSFPGINRREEDAGAAFVLESKGDLSPSTSQFTLVYIYFLFVWRAMVACGVSFDDGDSGAHNTDAAVRF